ncbi:glycosyl hydrolase [Roseivirga sp. BDSF3-8]|uniref:VPS10 domain-containing protein n=1 Tax=Roseivirga sp. BDSF3-8 TaxID=3241598 RepID=UPI003531864F
MKRILPYFLLMLVVMVSAITETDAQRRRRSQSSSSGGDMPDSVFNGIKFRSIGPAFMSGRIADLAIDPNDESTWYVAVGSGGVWKTDNAGVTWDDVFADQPSYSIGTITIDPNDSKTIWVGTGEDVGGRHMGFGDGVYLSRDGGNTWKNMGLQDSEHIAQIIVHPENSDVVWVASQGPLWSKGGQRGVYKTTDGGKTWNKTLGDEEWTGVTDLVMDPENPDRMYAATWQHHRTVAAYMGGGPKSGIYRSDDGGETWEEMTKGLPEGNMGKTGLAISPQDHNTIYAAIELDRRTGGVYRSTDGGSTWEKRSDAVSGGTGPHYYQELYASPHHEGTLYLMDASMQISDDGGKTFYRANREHRHGDNHALAFKDSDPDYIMVGTDGGVYESFDLGKNWRFISNLPITQFYKVAVDDAEPFYNIYGGTQDNSTQGGPSRTDNVHGIQNSDWRVVLNWDGHQPATEPGNPDIIYAERQEGTLSRVDITTGEVVDIQPQPAEDEDYERFNWDAPILVSPHSPTTIFFASQRVWKSENRGDEWTAISGDLTRDQERIELPIMGRKQSWDAPWDFFAMSNYNTITSLAESPQQKGLIYAGTDDGLVQVTEDGGQNWRKIEVGSMPGVPSTAFVNDIKADMYDANTVYVALDNHKYGDYKPYLVKSTDKGRSWTSIAGDLPGRTLVWRLVQDHEQPSLMFAGTETGIFFTNNGGTNWTELQGGLPTISFRDLAIQKRENDLVAASFGRGFFILDDYSMLREVTPATLDKEFALFPSRKAWWYVPRSHLSFDDEKGSQGASHFVAPNPDFGAVFTYYLKEGLLSKEEMRQKSEERLSASQNVSFPGYDALSDEANEQGPYIWLTIKDQQGNVVRKINGPVGSGFHRVAWDLRYPSPDMVSLDARGSDDEDEEEEGGMLAAPGTYTVTVSKQVDGAVTQLSEPMEFEVVPLREGALEGSSQEEVASFWREFENTARQVEALQANLEESMKQSRAMLTAMERAAMAPGELDDRLYKLRSDLRELDEQLNGNEAKREVGEKTRPTIGERMFAVYRGISRSTYGPTRTHRQSLDIVQKEMAQISNELEQDREELRQLSADLIAAGAPYVEGLPMFPSR